MKQGVESYSKRHHLVETTNVVNVQYGNYLENLKRSIDEFLSIVGPHRAIENRRRTFLANLDWNISYQLKRHRPARYPGEVPRLRIRFDETVVKRANRLAEKRAKIQELQLPCRCVLYVTYNICKRNVSDKVAAGKCKPTTLDRVSPVINSLCLICGFPRDSPSI